MNRKQLRKEFGGNIEEIYTDEDLKLYKKFTAWTDEYVEWLEQKIIDMEKMMGEREQIYYEQGKLDGKKEILELLDDVIGEELFKNRIVDQKFAKEESDGKES